MKIIHRPWALTAVLALAFLVGGLEAADADYPLAPVSPALLTLSQDLFLEELQKKRADKIRRLFRESGMTQEELGQAIGMDQSQLSKHLRGKLPWREKWLGKIAEVFNVPLMELLAGQPAQVPIVGRVGAAGEFPYPEASTAKTCLGLAPAPPGWDGNNHYYVLEIGEAPAVNLLPALRPGTLLYVEPKAGSGLADGQLAVAVPRPGVGRLLQVSFLPAADHICLTPLNPKESSREYPRSYLADLDRVCWVRL